MSILPTADLRRLQLSVDCERDGIRSGPVQRPCCGLCESHLQARPPLTVEYVSLVPSFHEPAVTCATSPPTIPLPIHQPRMSGNQWSQRHLGSPLLGVSEQMAFGPDRDTHTAMRTLPRLLTYTPPLQDPLSLNGAGPYLPARGPESQAHPWQAFSSLVGQVNHPWGWQPIGQSICCRGHFGCAGRHTRPVKSMMGGMMVSTSY